MRQRQIQKLDANSKSKSRLQFPIMKKPFRGKTILALSAFIILLYSGGKRNLTLLELMGPQAVQEGKADSDKEGTLPGNGNFSCARKALLQ